MARETLALYHPWGPTGWIIRRGYSWLSYGYCPCCYSSPPLPHCPICAGSRYGNDLDVRTGMLWAMLWYKRTTSWKSGANRWLKE